jgi:hypothetical protein
MNAEDPSFSIFVLVNDDISFDRCGLSLNKILAETENPATRNIKLTALLSKHLKTIALKNHVYSSVIKLFPFVFS